MPKQHINHIDLYYEITGAGPPLLLLHGLGSCIPDWQPQIDAFAGQHQIIAIDIRGHGQSDKPPGPYSIAQFTADVIALLRHLGLGPVHVAGLSMGGMIALQMALDAPELVTSLTLINNGPEIPNRTFAEKRSIWQRMILFRLFSMRKIGEVIGQRLFPNDHQAELLQTFIDRFAQNDKRAYLNATRALVNWSVLDRLGEITCPVLVVASDQDYASVDSKRGWISRLPNAELAVIENARHAVNGAQPEKFNPILAAFLARVSEGA